MSRPALPPSIWLVIMAGGSGTRFWPKSRKLKPKQMLNFGGPDSLLNQTLSRFEGWVDPSRRMIVTTDILAESIRNHVDASVKILAEPQGRNTAPCVYWAAREVEKLDPDSVMLVMPADHAIADVESFRQSIQKAAIRASETDELVTLGVRPTRPETGFGYLQTGKDCGEGCLRVTGFLEKPDITRAKKFLEDGNTLWNGGMFVWKTKSILSEFDRLMPEMKEAWDSTGGNVAQAYPKMTATSIDYGIMEKAQSVVTFPLDCGWDDLGSWLSIESFAAKIPGAVREGGVLMEGELLAIESTGNIVDAPGRLVALLGVRDLVVVESDGAILVAHKDRSQDIRQIVDALKTDHFGMI